MIYITLVLFALAVLFGLVNFFKVIRDKATNKMVAILHGLFALTALALLIIAGFEQQSYFYLFCMSIFLMAVVGGVFMFSRDMTNKKIPVGVMAAHAAFALIGFIILLV